MNMKLKLADINVEIAIDNSREKDRLLSAIKDELFPVDETNESDPVDFRFHFVKDKHYSLSKKAIRANNFFIDGSKTIFKSDEAEYVIHDNTKPINYISIYPKIGKNIRYKFKFFNRSYYNRTRSRIENFIYMIFVPYMQYKLLSHSKAFLHAAAITKNNEAILFAANPNIGKTSVSLKFVLNDGYRLLSDDLPIVSRDGVVYSYHRPLAVYPFHFRYSEFLRKNTFKGKGPLDIFHWYFWQIILGQERVLRRLPNSKIFNTEQLAQRATMKKIFFLLESTKDTFEIQKIDTKSLAVRLAYVYLYETHIHQNFTYPLYSILQNSNIPTTVELFEQLSGVYNEAFKNVDTHILYLPNKVTSGAVYTFIKNMI